MTFKALTASISATGAGQLRRILDVIASHSTEWAAKGWGGTIGVGLQGAHHVRLILENIRLDTGSARRSMRALTEVGAVLTIVEHNTYYSGKASTNFDFNFISLANGAKKHGEKSQVAPVNSATSASQCLVV
jgi:hypothetical protein